MDDSNTTSAFIMPITPDATNTFTDRTLIAERGRNVVVRAKRQGRWWALKGLSPQWRDDTASRLLLRKEYDLMASLTHSRVAMVSGMETVDGLGLCIVMEWIDGQNLSEWLASDRPHTAKQRWRIARQLIDALGYIHSRQVVHRDLKPSNVMITANGDDVKLIDFGISDADSYALFKQPAGTVGYVSPEQSQGGKPDRRNDIYSLGCLLRDLRLGVMSRHVVGKCLRPMAQRYSNVEEVGRALHRWHAAPYYILGVAIVAVLAVLVVAGWQGRPAATDTERVVASAPADTAQASTRQAQSQASAEPSTQPAQHSVATAAPKAIEHEATQSEEQWLSDNLVDVNTADTTTLNRHDCETINAAIRSYLPTVRSRMAKYDQDMSAATTYADYQLLKEKISADMWPAIDAYAAHYADKGHNRLAATFVSTIIKQRLRMYIQAFYLTPLSRRVQ